MRLPVVSIVGRPNVGKSTLFNRILRRRQAVVDATPGVTRDRHDAVAEWTGRSFILIDTGGLIHQSEEEMQRHITEQSQLAIEQSDLVVFLVDGQAGSHPADAEIAERIRKAHKPVVLAVNKIDGPLDENSIYDFAVLGLDDPIGVSALTGRQIGDLLDRIVTEMPPSEPEPADSLRLAIVGRPNVGKSSLVNRLLGEERMIVSNIPGTTRDSIDTLLEFDGRRFTLVDTAGLRKPARVRDQIEFYTALRTTRAIARADVACVLLDASQDLSTQDFKIAEAAADAGCGLFFAVNKWDLIEKDTDTAGAYAKDLQRRAQTFAWAPVVFISALTGQRASRILTMAATIFAERARRLTTPELTRTILEDIQRKPPPADKGRFIRIKFVTQSAEPPPTFVFFCNHPDSIGESYRRFIANRLRERFGFSGVPLRIRFRKKGK
jgi:GTP-binding protein